MSTIQSVEDLVITQPATVDMAETGECHGQLRRGNWFDGVHHAQCTCRQYVGPEPISSLWSPPVLPEGSER